MNDDGLVKRHKRPDDMADLRGFIDDDFAQIAVNPRDSQTEVERMFGRKTKIIRIHPLFCIEIGNPDKLYPTDVGELGFVFQKILD